MRAKKKGFFILFSFIPTIWVCLGFGQILADAGLIWPPGKVALFYKINNEIVMKQCADYTVLKSRSDCEVRPGTETWKLSIPEFKNSLKMALKLLSGNYDVVTKREIEIYNYEGSDETWDLLEKQRKLKEQISKVETFVEELGAKSEKLKQKLSQLEAQVERAEVDRLKEQVSKIEVFVEEFVLENGYISGLRQELSQLELQLGDFAQSVEIMTKINTEIDHLVDEVIADPLKTPQKSRYIFSMDGKRFVFNLLRAYAQAPEFAALPRSSLSPRFAEFFKRIEADSFFMGSPRYEKDRDRDEKQVEVAISRPFEIMTTEVTQMMWYTVMKKNPSSFKTPKDCDNHLEIDEEDLCPDRPISGVSWSDVQVYIQKRNEEEGIKGCRGDSWDSKGCYRLPTEAEWEYVARGGTETAYSFGDDSSVLNDYAWYGENSGYKTHPVGLKRPNPYGLYDVHGNVNEWVQDAYAESLPGGFDPFVDFGTYRVSRGGSCLHYNPIGLRSAFRFRDLPNERGHIVGFRLVRTL